VQAAAGIADELDEPILDVHVHVLERRIHRALATLEFARHLV
jgi:hypothetical protein